MRAAGETSASPERFESMVNPALIFACQELGSGHISNISTRQTTQTCFDASIVHNVIFNCVNNRTEVPPVGRPTKA